MILVTGASGLLGASVVSQAQERGLEVIGFYHRHPIHIEGVKLLAVDFADRAETCRIFGELRPSSVVHCAAATDVDQCEDHPDEAYRLNVTAAAAIAEITARSGVRLLYVSTDSVFDGERGHYSETDTPAPLNVYATTKLHGEREVARLNPAAIIARVSLYGWNAQNKDSLAEWVLKRLTLGKAVPGFSDVFFCPALANDVAEVLLELVAQNLSGIYHVVGSECISKHEFARRVAAKFAFDPEQVFATRMADAKLKALRPRDTSLNTAKVCAALRRSMPNVDAGLRRFAELRENGYADQLKNRLSGVHE
jgi:dTDP-4-dehydrorhamnose reductase